MTKDEFIDGYVGRSPVGRRGLERTPNGYRSGSYEYVALPCGCGEAICKGWAMIRNDPEAIADHERRQPGEDAEGLVEPIKDDER